MAIELEPGRRAMGDRYVISKWAVRMCLAATFLAGMSVGAALMAWAVT